MGTEYIVIIRESRSIGTLGLKQFCNIEVNCR